MSIPKIIHYFWFGRGEMSEKLKACVASWQKYCPDYKIKRWDEDNFDYSMNRFTREAYESRKWAFVSDAARLAVLYREGGIYMDTDVELLRPIDELLKDDGFIGFEKWGPNCGTAIIGAVPGHPWTEALMKMYENRTFIQKDGRLDVTVNTIMATQCMVEKLGLILNGEEQLLEGGVKVYPWDYFYPLGYHEEKIDLTENTYAIHYYSGTWESEANARYNKVEAKWRPILGSKAGLLAYIYTGFRVHGLREGLRIIQRRFRSKNGK